MTRTPELARRFFDRFEPVHGVTYFAPECREAMDALGCQGFWSGYFAGRAAPFGEVAAQIVAAAFYNFSVGRVSRSLAAAWAATTPEVALTVRSEAAVTALRRYGFADDRLVSTAAELAAKAARAAPVAGRVLFAANAALPWPGEPVAVLWHAVTLLREHRGDGHNAALVAAGVSGREANVLHCAAGGVPEAYIRRSRDYDDSEWEVCTQRLADRGLLRDSADGVALTTAGQELKDHVESVTNTVALSALEGLDDAEVEALFGALTPLTRLVVEAGDVPAMTPMGLRRNELDDDSAHLV